MVITNFTWEIFAWENIPSERHCRPSQTTYMCGYSGVALVNK